MNSPSASFPPPESVGRYVVGFLLDRAREHVVLIRKNRPAWQAGRLNGVGGKLEPGESAPVAMSREFYEETACSVHPTAWDPMCKITWPDDLARVGSGKAAYVRFYRCIWHDDTPLPQLVSTRTDEEVVVVPLPLSGEHRLIPNMTWLVPLAAYTADRYQPFVVEATVAEAVHPVALAP